MFNPIVSVNGDVGGTISPLDRGFNYGDGLFETVRLDVGGAGPCLPLWSYHRERLLRDCARLKIPLVEAELQDRVDQIVDEAGKRGIGSAIVKIVVTRGVGGRGYLAPDVVEPTVCVGLYPLPAHPPGHSARGVDVHLCSQVLSSSLPLAGIKHLNKLEYVVARSEWDGEKVSEGVLLDARGSLVEGTFTNVFLLRDGKLITPSLDSCGVAGVMRQLIISVLAPKLGLSVLERVVTLADVAAADEFFVCNSVCGIWPVLSLAGNCWQRGAVTAALQVELKAYIQGMCYG